jgi:hypothetical protein
MHKVLVVLNICLLLSLSLSLLGQNISPAMRKADKRLDMPITLSVRRAYFPDILKEIKKQTGVTLSMEERDPVSGLQITVECSEMPLSKVMNSLWSLVSSKEGEWVWHRTEGQNTYQYTLVQPERARQRAENLRRHTVSALNNLLEVCIELAKMPRLERLKQIERFQKALYQDSDALAQGLMAEDAETFWAQIQFYAEIVPPPLHTEILQGTRTLTVTWDSLPPAKRALLDRVWEGYRGAIQDPKTGAFVPEPKPTQITFFSQPLNLRSDRIVPLISIDLGNVSGSFGFLGGQLEVGLRNIIHNAWLLDGDTRDAPELENRVLEALPATDAPPNQKLETHFIQLAKGTKTPLFALLPTYQHPQNSTPFMQSIKNYVTAIESNRKPCMHKWRHGALLINYPLWFIDEETTTPYRLIRLYLEPLKKQFALKWLAPLIAELTPNQRTRLTLEHPLLEPVQALFPLLSLYKFSANLTTLSGMALNAEQAKALTAIPFLSQSKALLEGSAVAIRIREESIPLVGRVLLRMHVEVADKQGSWVEFSTFER